ncbi:MAG: hypothetical protein M3025_01035, partial [Actinomycetota bacterium]|nr:hypothetical protein [Actinomycetota bacterium]
MRDGRPATVRSFIALPTEIPGSTGRSAVLHYSWHAHLGVDDRVPLSAETEHASVRLLAGPLLTTGPKRNSETLSRGFR